MVPLLKIALPRKSSFAIIRATKILNKIKFNKRKILVKENLKFLNVQDKIIIWVAILRAPNKFNKVSKKN